MASWVDRLVEASFNKCAPEGYVFQSLSPWLLRPHYYLVNDANPVSRSEEALLTNGDMKQKADGSNEMNTFLGWALMFNQILFCVGAIGTFSYARSDDPRLGNYLASVTFFLAAGASYYLNVGWPLSVGFGLLWVYKLMGWTSGPYQPGRAS